MAGPAALACVVGAAAGAVVGFAAGAVVGAAGAAVGLAAAGGVVGLGAGALVGAAGAAGVQAAARLAEATMVAMRIKERRESGSRGGNIPGPTSVDLPYFHVCREPLASKPPTRIKQPPRSVTPLRPLLSINSRRDSLLSP